MRLNMEMLSQVDAEIRPLVHALREAGLDTDWSCSGETDQDMCIRPTIQIRTCPFPNNEFLTKQKFVIEQVMTGMGISEYWLSLVFTYGKLNTHGGEPTWLLQIPGRFDWLSLPVALSSEFTTGVDNLVENYRPLVERLDLTEEIEQGRADSTDNLCYEDCAGIAQYGRDIHQSQGAH